LITSRAKPGSEPRTKASEPEVASGAMKSSAETWKPLAKAASTVDIEITAAEAEAVDAAGEGEASVEEDGGVTAPNSKARPSSRNLRLA
jgi:hypothetical protein